MLSHLMNKTEYEQHSEMLKQQINEWGASRLTATENVESLRQRLDYLQDAYIDSMQEPSSNSAPGGGA